MLSFEEFVIALENEDEYKEKPNYLKWGLGATAALGAAGALALAGSSKAKKVEKAFSSAKKDYKFKDGAGKRESGFTHDTTAKKEQNVKNTARASTPSEKIEHKGHKTIVMYKVSQRHLSQDLSHDHVHANTGEIHYGSSEDRSENSPLSKIKKYTQEKKDSNGWSYWKSISSIEAQRWSNPNTTFWVRYDFNDPDKKILKELNEYKSDGSQGIFPDHLKKVLSKYEHEESGKPVSVKYYRVLNGKENE